MIKQNILFIYGGDTALIIASIDDHLKIADYLIQNGADIDKKDLVFKDLFF